MSGLDYACDAVDRLATAVGPLVGVLQIAAFGAGTSARKLKDALEIASDLSAQINASQCRRETTLKLIKQVVVSDSQLAIEVKLDALMSDDARVPQRQPTASSYRSTGVTKPAAQSCWQAHPIAAQPLAQHS